MSNTWLEFLSAQDAIVENGRVISFGSSAQPCDGTEHTCVCELTPWGLIHVTGEEAESFLHSQFTNDLKQVTTRSSQLSSYCNPKGRILSIFRIFKRDNGYFLILPKEVLEVTLRKLVMFKLRTKADLLDKSGQLVLFGIAGPKTETVLESLNIAVPQKENDCLQEENGTSIIRLPSESTRVLFVTTVELAASLWKQLSEELPVMTSRLWDLHDILSGIPQVTADTSEAFTPQMTNLELIDGVSFTKGCYPGQEVVARTHYLGKPNRRMYRAAITTDHAPRPGTNIFSLEESNQAVGKVVISQMASANSACALIVLRTEKQDDPNLHIESTTGPSVSIQTLPYSLEPRPA